MQFPPGEYRFQVSEITAHIKEILEQSFSTVAIEGEISNFRPAGSGHWYFTLKDRDAVIQAVMFKYRSARVAFTPADGQKVVVRGNISVYAKRGNYQIICDSMEKAGEGDILAMLEERKRKLAAEGLFAEEKKQPLPFFPTRIAVVTSPTGAAIRDILQVLGRRSSGLDVVVLPAAVQGDSAGSKIAAQIRRANLFQLGDVIITGRGGGSLEDLLPFSEEEVVRAVAESEIPVISAVGHEIDTALSDYAADVSAPTPSAAAEIVSKSREELSDRVRRLRDEMSTRIQNRVENAGLLIRQFTPENLEERFRQVLQPYQLRLDDAKEEAVRNLQELLTHTRHRVAMLKASIEGNSPLTILQKGYAVVTDRHSGVLIGSVQQSTTGDLIDIRLHDGRLGATVENRYPRSEEETP
ncbi:MAG: exodeoxyribonuclease VII large subunit [Spirochaetia bacterium]